MEFITSSVGCGSGGGFDPVSGSVTSDLGGCIMGGDARVGLGVVWLHIKFGMIDLVYFRRNLQSLGVLPARSIDSNDVLVELADLYNNSVRSHDVLGLFPLES